MRVLKKNAAGETVWRYEGRTLQRGENFVVLEAFFDRDDLPFQGTVFKRGDRFVETYFSDKRYNIFEIYDRDDGTLKGWYCNVCLPAVIGEDEVSYMDLALDLWVAPDGKQTVLDEDELEALEIPDDLKRQAREGLRELRERFSPRCI